MTGYKLTTHADHGWRDDALCQQFPTEMFFPDSMEAVRAVTAKKICHACPVEKQCLNFALSLPDLTGIFGGTTPPERVALRRTASAVA